MYSDITALTYSQYDCDSVTICQTGSLYTAGKHTLYTTIHTGKQQSHSQAPEKSPNTSRAPSIPRPASPASRLIRDPWTSHPNVAQTSLGPVRNTASLAKIFGITRWIKIYTRRFHLQIVREQCQHASWASIWSKERHASGWRPDRRCKARPAPCRPVQWLYPGHSHVLSLFRDCSWVF